MMWLNTYVLHPLGAPCMLFTLPARILCFPARRIIKKCRRKGKKAAEIIKNAAGLKKVRRKCPKCCRTETEVAGYGLFFPKKKHKSHHQPHRNQRGNSPDGIPVVAGCGFVQVNKPGTQKITHQQTRTKRNQENKTLCL